MAPIELKKVIEVSSEDAKFPASNLPLGSKWMNSKLDQSGKATVELLLKFPSLIHYIDLGYQNIAQIEIQVSLSTWKSYHDPLTLLPSVVLQTLQDVRAEVNKNGCQMFNFNEHLNQEIAKQKWDKIKLIIQQPYARNKQMGIDFLRLGTLSTLKSCNKETINKNETDTPTPTWKDSPIGKLMSSAESTSPLGLKFGDKFCKLSSDPLSGASCYSRTAKMIMSSKLASLKARERNSTPSYKANLLDSIQNINNHQKSLPKKQETFIKTRVVPNAPERNKKDPKKFVNGNKKTFNSGLLAPKNVNFDKAIEQKNLKSPQVKRPLNSSQVTPKPNSVNRAHEAVKKTPISKANGAGSPSLAKKNKLISNKSVDSRNRNFKGTVPYDINALEVGPQEPSVHNTQSLEGLKSNPVDIHIGKIPTLEKHDDSSSRSTNPTSKNITSHSAKLKSDCIVVQDVEDNDVQIIDDSKMTNIAEVTYTDEQIKLLKRAIKKFFNKLDMDSFNLENVRIKDLRKRFEESHDVKLNRDARVYFREITGRFMNLLESSRKHKKNIATLSTVVSKNEPASKRKSTESTVPSPEKIPRQLAPTQAATSSDYQQCPICFGYIEKSLIEDHAAFCGQEEEILPDLRRDRPTETEEEESGVVVDCSENSCLTRVEQQRWIQFSKEPKPFHQRLNTSSFVGHVLVRCPSCGLKYKSSEIEAHCNDCTDKVNSGCTRMGLYLIDKKKKKTNKKAPNANTISLID